jgi:hypothetical protein
VLETTIVMQLVPDGGADDSLDLVCETCGTRRRLKSEDAALTQAVAFARRHVHDLAVPRQRAEPAWL